MVSGESVRVGKKGHREGGGKRPRDGPKNSGGRKVQSIKDARGMWDKRDGPVEEEKGPKEKKAPSFGLALSGLTTGERRGSPETEGNNRRMVLRITGGCL